jgi:hypothetical protein
MEPYAPPKASSVTAHDPVRVEWWSRGLALVVGGLCAFSALAVPSTLYLMSYAESGFGTLSMVAAYSAFCAFSWYKGTRAFWNGNVNRWVWLFAPVVLSFVAGAINILGMMMPGD